MVGTMVAVVLLLRLGEGRAGSRTGSCVVVVPMVEE